MWLTARAGASAQLEYVWGEYGIAALGVAGGDAAYVIDREGVVRARYGTGGGQQSAAMTSSFAVLLAGAARDALAS